MTKLKLASLINPIGIFGLILFSSCKDNLTSVDLSKDYFPLQVGNYWQIDYMGTMTIDRVISLDGKDYYRMLQVVSTRTDTTYYRKDSNGNVYTRKLKTEEGLMLDFNAPLNQFYYSSTIGGKLLKKDGEVILGNSTLRSCYVFYIDPRPAWTDDEYTLSLAPGIGYVFIHGGYSCKLLKARINGIERTFQ